MTIINNIAAPTRQIFMAILNNFAKNEKLPSKNLESILNTNTATARRAANPIIASTLLNLSNSSIYYKFIKIKLKQS